MKKIDQLLRVSGIIFLALLSFILLILALIVGLKLSKIKNKDQANLNSVNLSEAKYIKDLHKYESKIHITGDGINAYAQQLEFDNEIITKSKYWHKLTNSSNILIKDSVKFANSSRREINDSSIDGTNWFPRIDLLDCEQYYVYVSSLSYRNLRLDGMLLYILDIEKKVLYGVGGSK